MMRTFRLVGIAAVTLVLGVIPTAGAAPTSYTDPSGDNGPNADVGAVSVELGGDATISLDVAVANLPATGQEGALLVALDTDRNGATGSIMGGDYLVGYLTQVGGASAVLLRWDGTQLVSAGIVPAQARQGGLQFRIPSAAIGGATAFNFAILAITGNAQLGQADLAPDNGVWLYEYKPPEASLPAPTLKSVSATFVPATPRAGSVFRVAAPKLGLSDGSIVPATQYRCSAKLSGRVLRGLGAGGCTFRLPKGAKGKRLAINVFGTYAGATKSSKLYVFRVR